MNICYLCPDLGISVDGCKGASSHIRGFIGALQDLGQEVSLLTTCPVREECVDFPVKVIPEPALMRGIAADVNPRAYRAMRHLFYNTEIMQALQHVFQNNPPDLLYERYSPFSAAGGIAARQMGIPHILEVNAPLAEQGKLYRKQALQDACEVMEITAFRQAGLIVTLTEELKGWLIGLGIPAEKIKVRPCGVDETVFQSAGAHGEKEYEGKVVLGFVGSLKPWHDLPLLADVFRILAADPQYHLLVVGDGPMRKVLEPLLDELPGRVTLTGAVEQLKVPDYIHAMDIALAPYPAMDLFYFSPLKAYEYMAMGKPVIATGIGQLNTLIHHGENGWLVPPGDPMAWVTAVRHLAANAALREKLGKEAQAEIRRHHTWEKRAQSFIRFAGEYLTTYSTNKEAAVSLQEA